MCVRGRHCDYSSQAPKNSTMPLHTQIPKSLSSMHIFLFVIFLTNLLTQKRSYGYHANMGLPNLRFDFLQLIITWRVRALLWWEWP